MEATSLGDLFRRSVARYGEKTALLLPPEKGQEDFTAVTYREFGEQVRRFCAAFIDAGLKRKDRLVILSENGSAWTYADFAAQCLGVIIVPIYPTLPADQVKQIVDNCGATIVLVGSPDLARKVEVRDDLRIWPLKGEGSVSEAALVREMPLDDWNREIDATHLSVFNQLEGLYVDKEVSLADLKGTLEFFFREIFGPQTKVRFRPHFFPFTEPSFEIDILLEVKGKEPRWIEIAGCGMVDPAVFDEIAKKRGDDLLGGEKVTGFAFGLGLDRLAMILHGITDIRHLIDNDTRFLGQFA
jgi:hypothetical protein